MKWYNHLFSINELRVSALILCLIGSLTFGLVVYWYKGTIEDPLKEIIITLISTVAAVNIGNMFSKNGSTDTTDTSVSDNGTK